MTIISSFETRVVNTVTLKLTEEECRFLFDVMANVGGNPQDSRRKIADAFTVALSCAFPDWKQCRPDDMDPARSSIYFLILENT